ncbi:hypothetical protein JZ751_026733 [Albula glossodonta]|uniref:Uncharacterized protein n=1 Tax=Albula glossodonta TaxID=121402 RepID=A0A8T2PL91_9TELE|nr:hypothetical protein JZ751_026733 [Albula glossodonta]
MTTAPPNAQGSTCTRCRAHSPHSCTVPSWPGGSGPLEPETSLPSERVQRLHPGSLDRGIFADEDDLLTEEQHHCKLTLLSSSVKKCSSSPDRR